MVLFGEEKDWKEFLCEDIKIDMAELLEDAKKNRCAYMQADDVKIAQIWCALAETSKRVKNVESKIAKLETAVKAIVEIGEIAKRETIREKMRDVLKPKTAEEKEKVEKIVDSLMEF
jgi:5'-deoxynucleotidase YfbR-like HD superfamily hydrolase